MKTTTISDDFGDTLEVSSGLGVELLAVYGGRGSDFLLSPKAARKLAKALRKAAKAAEASE